MFFDEGGHGLCTMAVRNNDDAGGEFDDDDGLWCNGWSTTMIGRDKKNMLPTVEIYRHCFSFTPKLCDPHITNFGNRSRSQIGKTQINYSNASSPINKQQQQQTNSLSSASHLPQSSLPFVATIFTSQPQNPNCVFVRRGVE